MFFQLISLILVAVICVYVFAWALVFLQTKTVYLLTPYDVIDILRDPLFLAPTITVLALIVAIILLYLYIKSEYKKYQHFRENRIYSISLQELAQIWGANRIHTTVKETIPVVYLKNFTQERTRDFVVRVMEKNIRFFPQEKLEIIFELLKILENEAVAIPSVASKFRGDPEKSGSYQAVITPDGKTSYDIFYEVSLYNHTMNVVEKAIEFLKEKDPISFETSMCDGIIVALAHDIGKLHKIRQFNKEYPNEILMQNPHQAISKMFFGEMWAGYLGIEEAIYNHHSAPNSTSLLTRMIIHADKEARKMEMLAWQLHRNEEKRNTLEAPIQSAQLEDETVNTLPVIEGSKKSRTKQKRFSKELQEESLLLASSNYEEDPIEKSYEIASPQFDTSLIKKQYDTPESIDFNDALEAKIMNDLRQNINVYTLEKPQGINSISYNDTILFSITFYNSVIKKHIYVSDEDQTLVKKIGMFISSIFFDKGYVRYMQKDAGCSIFFLTISKKHYKFMCVPFKAEVFNMNTFELDSKKDAWLNSIRVSEYRTGVQE